jgi:hypothetical protein
MTIIGRNPGSNVPALSEPRQFPLAAPPADELALMLQFARAEKSLSTRRAYCSDFEAFRKWCTVRKLDVLYQQLRQPWQRFWRPRPSVGLRLPPSVDALLAFLTHTGFLAMSRPDGQKLSNLLCAAFVAL